MSWHTFISAEAANVVGEGVLESVEVAEHTYKFRGRKEENKATRMDLRGVNNFLFSFITFNLPLLLKIEEKFKRHYVAP